MKILSTTFRGTWLPLVIASLALFCAVGGPTAAADATVAAKKLITGKQIKSSTLTGRHIKNGSLTAADFRVGSLPAGPAGAPGAPGPQGPPGPASGGAKKLFSGTSDTCQKDLGSVPVTVEQPSRLFVSVPGSYHDAGDATHFTVNVNLFRSAEHLAMITAFTSEVGEGKWTPLVATGFMADMTGAPLVLQPGDYTLQVQFTASRGALSCAEPNFFNIAYTSANHVLVGAE